MGCCCLGWPGLWLGPRFILLLIWLLSDWTTHTFRTTLWPLLGFIFLPFTTLFYLLSMHYQGYRRTGISVFWATIGLLLDLSVVGGTHQTQMQPRSFRGRESFQVLSPVVMSNRVMAYRDDLLDGYERIQT